MLKTSQVMGVQGVMEFTSGKPGPRLYLGTCTHGNEKVGSGLVVPLLKGRDGGIELVRGSIVIAVNNLLAASQDKRFAKGDINMNRLPPDILDGSMHTSQLPAVLRIRELHRAGLLDVTHGFDAHTIPTPADAVKIHIKGPTDLAHGIGIRDYITRITEHQQDADGVDTLSFGSYIGGRPDADIPVVEVEGGGPHADPKIFRDLLNGLLATLGRLGMVRDDLITTENGEQREYEITTQHIAPEGFHGNAFDNFAQVAEGEVVADDATDKGRQPFVTPHEGHIVFPPCNETFGPDGDSWWFSKPVKVTTQQFVSGKGL